MLLVLIADTGRVEQRAVDLPQALSADAVTRVRSRLLPGVVGRRCGDLAESIGSVADEFPDGERGAVAALVATLLETAVEREEQRVVLGGTANLARYRDVFATNLEPVLEALEEQVVLLRLLGEVSAAPEVMVRIGHENPVEHLQGTSVVVTGYGREDEAVAGLGIVGPTHMDYPGSIAAVRAVAQYLGRILGEQ